MSSGDVIRVSIVEDEKNLRKSFSEAIEKTPGYACIGLYPDAESAIAGIPRVPPDVVILDINLPGMNGIECLRRLRPLVPDAKFLMFTVYDESEKIFEALVAGASGYILKRAGDAELIEAIRQVLEGGAPMSSMVAWRIVRHFNQVGKDVPEIQRLSVREREVLELLAEGESCKGVADKLVLSIATVRMNVKHIYTKLHVHSRAAAVAKYLKR